MTPTTAHSCVVLAIGGNALAPDGRSEITAEREGALRAATQAVAITQAGRRVIIVHGNGPQVGALALAQEAVSSAMPQQPLFALGAMTQGQLGYLLAQAVGDVQEAIGLKRSVVALATQVVVDPADPAFATPTKPIGPFFPEGRAKRLSDSRGWAVQEDSGRGWRRVVASPDPLEVVEWGEIRKLVDSGEIVIACGGGGVPVAREGERLVGVEAVIDKDYSAALVGRLVGATTLVLVTGVERVALDFGKPTQRDVAEMTVEEARAHLDDGQFPPGSMGPKVDAGIRFVEGGGGEAIICSLERSADAIAGLTGTRIVP